MTKLVPTSLTTVEGAVGDTDPVTGKRIWISGTLRYGKPALFMLFFWLLCNDLGLMLMEQVAPQLTPILLKDHGASNKDIALYMATLAGVFTIWINPFVSTWSDRHRSPYGRRRPFLFLAAPACALLLGLIPFAPRMAAILGLSATTGAVMLIGICYIFYAIFNSVILAVFMYYFWDVVPEPLLGRFTALVRVISTIVGFLWNYLFFGLAEKHMEGIFVGIALFFGVVYLISLWQVKEGEYPLPEVRRKGGFVAPIRAYFLECYGHSYYLWIYAAMAVCQIGNLSYVYQIFYIRDTVGLDMDMIGKMRAWPGLALALIAYPLGALIDHLKPARIVAPSLIIWSLANFFGFFFLHGPWTFLVFSGLIALANYVFGISYGVMNVEIFPREKLGQFCSATTVTYQVICLFLAVPLGMLFDYLKDYRDTFLWSACFQALSAILFFKVYLNWKQLGGRPPVPNSG